MMSLLPLRLVLLATVAQGLIPDGVVTYTCGSTVSNSNHNARNAQITIKADMPILAKIRCADSVIFRVDHIPAWKNETTARIYYTNESGGTAGSDCFFYHPHGNSNLYTVEMDAYWGTSDYDSYSITCTSDGSGSATHQKDVDLSYKESMPITEALLGNVGAPYTHTTKLRLLDILGNQITTSSLTLGKWVSLELSISGGSAAGLTPHSCYAENSDGSMRYDLLNLGCGDGVIFPKNTGFTTLGTSFKSPLFRVFSVANKLSSSARSQISFSCSFSVCSQPCDGSSCALRQVKRRSSGTEVTVKSVRFTVSSGIEVDCMTIFEELTFENSTRLIKVLAISVAVILCTWIACALIIFVQCRRRQY